MELDELARRRMEELAAQHQVRRPPTIAGSQGPVVTIEGRDYVGLCSNNYLGFADDPRLLAVAHRALDEEGLGAGASRLVSGTMVAHRAAERRLADYLGTSDAVLFATGYAANVGTLEALAGPDDVLFSDALNHASLIDGCRLSRARIVVYRHRDLEHLEALLRAERASGAQAFIVSDAVFSMDGDEADLPGLRALADRYAASLVIDEAHALGVLGPKGRGLAAEHGVPVEVRVGTLGKSFGAAGAFAAASAAVVEWLRHRARSYVFSTAPLPVQARVAITATDLVEAADDRREALARNTTRLREGLAALGYRVPAGRTPIVPVLVGEDEPTMRLSAALRERGVFAQGIRPPTVPRGTSRLRCVPMATHTDAHLDRVLEAFAAVRTEATR